MWITDLINKMARPAPEWAVQYYEKRGKHYQKRYDKIDSWEFSPAMQEILRTANRVLPEVITKYLWKQINKAYKKFGPDVAEKYIKETLKKLVSFSVALDF